MHENWLWLELIEHYADIVRWTVKEIESSELDWQPHPEANNIGVTLWHMGRTMDLFKVRLFENRPVNDQLWFANGYVDKAGYDPRGLGFEGFGNLAGYSIEEMQAIPHMSGDLLLDYFDETFAAMVDFIKETPHTILESQAPGWPNDPMSINDWLKNLIADGHAHTGEIRAMRAQYKRETTH